MDRQQFGKRLTVTGDENAIHRKIVHKCQALLPKVANGNPLHTSLYKNVQTLRKIRHSRAAFPKPCPDRACNSLTRSSIPIRIVDM